MLSKNLTLIVIFSLFAFAFAACTGPNPSGDPRVQMENDSKTGVNNDLQLGAGNNQQPNQQVATQGASPMTETITTTKAVIKTSKGNITLKLYPDQTPSTVSNFAQKSQSGFYNNLTFHRVEDWVIQGGDPLGNGTGGGKLPTELTQTPFKEGSLGVARGGDIRVSNDAQFFICTTDCSWLTGQYTNFGEVIEGMDVAKKIEVGDKILGVEISE